MDSKTNILRKYKKAVAEWEEARKPVDLIMEKMKHKPGEQIYFLTEEDIDALERGDRAWKKVIEIARRA